ncbi:MAG: DUF5330 domain-containing protein [Methyloceanibacter sp.]
MKVAYFLQPIVCSPYGKVVGGTPAIWIERGAEMFLIRTGFWLIVLILLLPTNEQQQSQVYGTAQAAVKDVSSFCERNPGVCATGKDAFDVFVEKAQFGAEMLMGFVKEQTGVASGEVETTPSADEIAAPEDPDGQHSSLDQASVAEAGIGPWTVSPVTVDPVSAESTSSQNTLDPNDLRPAWDGPYPADSSL